MQESLAEKMEGVEITNEPESTPLMNDQEASILELYDRLEELQLEIALLKAQGVLSQGDSAQTLRSQFCCHVSLTTHRPSQRSI